jgi:hypothetical protein
VEPLVLVDPLATNCGVSQYYTAAVVMEKTAVAGFSRAAV